MGGGDFVSAVGKGSTFTVRIPVSNNVSAAGGGLVDIEPAKDDSAALLSPKNLDVQILYIEDNPSNQKVMKKVVSRSYTRDLLISADAEGGVAMAVQEKPNLILMDINLPGMDGYEVLEELKRNPQTADIPVIAISANAMPHDLEKAEHAGFHDYLTKPIDIAEVLAAIKNAITAR